MKKLCAGIATLALGMGLPACAGQDHSHQDAPTLTDESQHHHGTPNTPAIKESGQDDEVDDGAAMATLDDKSDQPVQATLRRIASYSSGLRIPTALDFNPRKNGELWVVNYGDDSMVIIHNATSTGRKSVEHRKDGYALHFMPAPTSISFGADETSFGLPGTFATCGESRNTYENMAAPNDFMGPTLWSSDLDIFANENPYGLGSHIDMLHETPLCMGIVHEKKNVYWAIGGLTPAVYRYDFQVDHNIGEDDHSDGTVAEYVAGQVSTVEQVPSHLVIDSDGSLYIADTGNSRIAKLDTKSGKRGSRLSTPEPLQDAYRVTGATLSTVVSSSSGLLKSPSGLVLHDDLLWVTDAETSQIAAFTKSGTRKLYINTGLPKWALSGLAFGPDGKLYIVDRIGNRILRVEMTLPL